MLDGRISLRTSISTRKPQMQIVVDKHCVISFECSKNWEVIYEEDKIIIREVKAFLDEVVSRDIELKDGDIYDKIVQLCKLRRMSVMQLSRMIGMPYTTLMSKITRHQKKVSEEFINAVAIALDVEPNELKEMQHHD